MDNNKNEQINIGRYLVKKDQGNKEVNSEKERDRISEHVGIGNETLINGNIIRIEYPGLVKNTDKALETLGGLSRLEEVVRGTKNTLDLQFHPDNHYNKPCTAEKDTNPGILIKVKTSRDQFSQENKIDYEVIGATVMNFKFNKLCDFQYLPVLEKDDGEDEFIYEKVFPQNIPDLKWFLSDNIKNQQKFHCPPTFSRFDMPTNKLYLNAFEKFNLDMNRIESEITPTSENERTKNKLLARHMSYFINLLDPNVEIPSEPFEITMKVVAEKEYQEDYNKLKMLFDERPIWLKAGIQFTLQLSTDRAKILLPSVAYFSNVGPWRNCWVRFGYNPLKDFNSRIYQTLDYRIRTSEGTQIYVDAKRKYTKMKKPLIVSNKLNIPEERAFILKPPYIPPARQMFYQLCDVHLSAIQEMLQRLPKIPTHMKFDHKNGWLPANFTDQCREIVNKYILEQIHKEIRQNKTLQLQSEESEVEHEEEEDEPTKTITYCSKMLSNIKRGIYKSVNVIPRLDETASSSQIEKEPECIDTISLLEDRSNVSIEEIEFDDVVNSIPERMDENSDEDSNSDLDIDMEAVEEINEILSSNKKRYTDS